MEFARGAAARADADGRHGMPHPSLHAQMMMEALRRELWEEGIRQEIIAAELAARRELEAGFRREPGSYRDAPLRIRAGLRPTTLSHRDTSPAPHGEPLGVPLSPAGASMSRRPVKDRIEEWYRPPWHRTADDERSLFHGEARLHKKALSGVKRKRTAEAPLWICSICEAKCYRETDLQNHLRGRRHQESIEALQIEGREIEAKLHEKKGPQLAEKYQKPESRWKCSICKANCSSESDLESHLRGRRHQRNVQAQC